MFYRALVNVLMKTLICGRSVGNLASRRISGHEKVEGQGEAEVAPLKTCSGFNPDGL